MSTGWKIWGRGCMAVSVVLFLTACGGGGGSSSKTTSLVDPASAYTGITTRATVSPENAEKLAMDGANIIDITSNLTFRSSDEKGGDTAKTDDRTARQLTQVVKQSLRRMDLPGKIAERQQLKSASGMANAARVESTQVPGEGGGYVFYTYDINDATGSVSGVIDYYGYTSGGITLSGSAEMSGTLDANLQEFSRFTISFKSLTMGDGVDSIKVVGSLSWGFNLASSAEILTINMVVIDNADNRTYWSRDYEISDTFFNGGLTETISGRYYDPDDGYVDFTTLTPLVYDGTDWPVQGRLLFSGGQGTWVRLTFFLDHLQIEADTDGNGVADWQIERPTNLPPPVNSPPVNSLPVAAAGLDQTVTQWSTVLLDGSSSHDANGDPLTYYWTFDSCPQSTCPGLTGANTATPSFRAERTGTYLLRLTVYDGQSISPIGPTDTVSVTATPVPPSEPNLLQKQWQYGLYGTSIGRAGLLTADLDGDGTPEIVASASNTFWYIVRQGADGSYEQLWQSENYPTTIVRLALADLSGDSLEDIMVGLADGSVYIYDGSTRQEIRKLTVATSLTTLAIADLDGDGSKEFVSSDGIGLFVYATDTGALLWSSPRGGGSSLAVGNVDADPAQEIVTATYGSKGYVIDGITHAITWEVPNGFGAQVKLGDLDGDGMEEIVAADAWSQITIIDADRKSAANLIPTDHDINAVLVTDTDGDGIPEILYGDGQWGSVHAIDVRLNAEKWSVSNPEHGVSGLAWGDVDGDGKGEVLWGAGGSSSGPDHLYIADPSTGTIEWQSQHLDGPLSAVAVGDVDDDGEDEIVMVSFRSGSGYEEGVIHIFNAQTHDLEFQEKLGIQDWMGVRSVKIGDVDGDGKTEFVVTTGNLYDGVIRVYDGASHTLKKESAGYNGNFFTALAIGDVDNDGKMEIVAGQGRAHSGAAGAYLIVFDGTTLQEKWRSADQGNYWGGIYDIKLDDVDKDGHPDIVATVDGSRLVVYDGVNHNQKLLVEHPARAVEVADIDGDGVREILVGREDGKIDLFSGATFALTKTVSAFSSASVDALRVADLDGNGTQEWLVCSGGFLTVLEGEGQGLKWRSSNLSGNLGRHNHLVVKDSDGDGRQEIFLGSDLALYHFK